MGESSTQSRLFVVNRGAKRSLQESDKFTNPAVKSVFRTSNESETTIVKLPVPVDLMQIDAPVSMQTFTGEVKQLQARRVRWHQTVFDTLDQPALQLPSVPINGFVFESVDLSSIKPTVKSVSSSAKPMAVPIAKPADSPIVKHVDVPIARQVTMPIAKPVDSSIVKPMSVPIAKPVDSPIVRSTVRPIVPRPSAAPMTKLVIPPFKRPITPSITGPMTPPIVNSMTQPIARPTAQPIAKSLTPPIARSTIPIMQMAIPNNSQSIVENRVQLEVDAANTKTTDMHNVLRNSSGSNLLLEFANCQVTAQTYVFVYGDHRLTFLVRSLLDYYNIHMSMIMTMRTKVATNLIPHEPIMLKIASVDTFEFLIKLGFNPMCEDTTGRTVFHYACHLGFYEYAQANNLNICTNTIGNVCPICCGTKTVPIVRYLIDVMGLKVTNHCIKNTQSPTVLHYLLNNHFDINACDTNFVAHVTATTYRIILKYLKVPLIDSVVLNSDAIIALRQKSINQWHRLFYVLKFASKMKRAIKPVMV
jgi:hypothetical protein